MEVLHGSTRALQQFHYMTEGKEFTKEKFALRTEHAAKDALSCEI